FRLLRTLGGQPGLLLLGQAGLLCRGGASFFGSDLLQLPLCKVGIEAVGILREEGFPAVAGGELQGQFVVLTNSGLRIGLRTGRDRLCRHQRNVVAAERAVDIRLLLVAGILQDLVADKAEGAPEIETGLWQMLDEGSGEG